MKLPKEINTVTPFSKIVALILFISLPIMFFFMGMRYEKNNEQTEINVVPITRENDPFLPQPTILPIEGTTWKIYHSPDYKFSIQYPEGWKFETSNIGDGYSTETHIIPYEVRIGKFTGDPTNLASIVINPEGNVGVTPEDNTHRSLGGLNPKYYSNEPYGGPIVESYTEFNIKGLPHFSIDVVYSKNYQKFVEAIMSSLTFDSVNKTSKLQVCPETWADNQMPCTFEKSPSECGNREYFIVNGQKKNFEEVDVAWVKQHCAITPVVVQ